MYYILILVPTAQIIHVTPGTDTFDICLRPSYCSVQVYIDIKKPNIHSPWSQLCLIQVYLCVPSEQQSEQTLYERYTLRLLL